MGRLKQLLPLGSKPVLRHGIDALIAAGVSDIVVVCGAHEELYAEALKDSKALLVRNEEVGSQMADSVKLGLRALESERTFSGLLVCLADHPLVGTETFGTLVHLHHEAPEKIIIPVFKGGRGHPVLFPADIVSDIYFMPSLRDIVREDPARVLLIDVPDEGVVLDMDTESDYLRARELYDARENGRSSGENHV
jgi:molybdenum cofactor cytidylyltransferase